MSKKLYELYVDCGRMGAVEGLFIATQDEVDNAIGSEVWFGEVLGKHSDIGGELEPHEVSVIDIDSDAVEKLYAALGSNLSGFNPLDYLVEDE